MNNLKDLTNMFLVFAEDEAKQRHVMTMKDWIDATDDLLKFRRKEVLKIYITFFLIFKINSSLKGKNNYE